MYQIYYNNYLMHYGVKGMKWGVRNDPESFYNRGRNIRKYGWSKGHGINVNNRINRIKKDKSRQRLMSKRQKQSLENASKYWSNRAAGKGIGESGKRNIIKREADSFRSLSFKRRASYAAVNNVLSSYGNYKRSNESGFDFGAFGMEPMSKGQAASQAVLGTAGSLAVDEVLNRAFGHY